MKGLSAAMLITLVIIMFLSGREFFNRNKSIENSTKIKPISLPEEFPLVRQGDLLIVERVSDSIYLDFKH